MDFGFARSLLGCQSVRKVCASELSLTGEWDFETASPRCRLRAAVGCITYGKVRNLGTQFPIRSVRCGRSRPTYQLKGGTYAFNARCNDHVDLFL